MYTEQLERSSDSNDVETARRESDSSTGIYQPESPFLPEPSYQIDPYEFVPHTPDSSPNAESFVLETPFISEYELGETRTESYEAALHREIMEEIYDHEFEEALEDLINDVREVYEDRFVGEVTQDLAEAERHMTQYLMPLEEAVTSAIDKMIAEINPIDNETLHEVQLGTFLENFEYQTELEVPAFDNFFKKIFKKIKKIAKKGFKVIKKAGKVLKKFSPLHIILGKLKKLVRPLLNRVLKFALNKVPARFRPLAKRLARRFIKAPLGELGDGEISEEFFSLEDAIERSDAMASDPLAAAYTPEIINAEFDALITGYIFEGEDFEYEPAVASYLSNEQFEGENAADDFDRARDRFIREIMNLEDEEDPTVVVEQFIPAILAALKVGIKLIGRRRVVNFLAKLVAKLIRRFVGKQAAIPLSRTLVSTGLSLVNLENPEELEYATGEIIASTIEETIDKFVSSASDEVFEDEDLMEVYVLEAFEDAVARNFPPQLLRKELRQGSTSKGTWILQPSGRRRKRYKKFTEQFTVKITPQMAGEIKSFGGQVLTSFLKEQLGLPIDKEPVNATVHLYEAIRGTWLSHISRLERGVKGLGSSRRSAWMQIHPLTCEAASLLIPNNVGLCHKVGSRFLVNRNRIAVGQRFYFLDIPEARVVRAPASPPGKLGSGRQQPSPAARASEVNVTIDFNQKRIRIYDFLSEAASTEVAQNIRAGRPLPALISAIKTSLGSAIKTIMSGEPGDHLQIKRETPAEETFVAAVAPVLRFVGGVIAERLLNFVINQLIKQIKLSQQAFSKDFVAAAENTADGVTLIFTLSQIDTVFDALTSDPITRARALLKLRSGGISGVMNIDVRAGFHRN